MSERVYGLGHIIDENLQERIRKQFPDFNFIQVRSKEDISSIIRSVKSMEDKHLTDQKLELIKEKGIEPECLVMNSLGEVRQVVNILPNGYIVFKGLGLRGNPRYWRKLAYAVPGYNFPQS